ncbi:hemopexin repeat-containing protein [Streptomyces sp. CBMA152]|uniref:hemopexin repeat-containing protein n=1 Tax=Streptomyces sp. CBMA152 TaxID=1896312 RepID=UPI00166056F5|nr:hemopexin repeat-containing protein [Streptomyces sp. CBMA152]MBD0741483.1 hypothetical protein [Streptomyces sp. CBMA152]
MTVVVAAGLMAAMAPADAFADGPAPLEREWAGGKTVEDPKDTPASGLAYQYVLPFYQKHGFYLQDAAPSQRIAPGIQQTLSLGREDEVVEATQTGVDDGGTGEWKARVFGGLKAVAKAVAKSQGGESAESIVDALIPDFSTSSVVADKTVKFNVTNTINVTAKRDIEARAVYYKLKTVSDVWKRERDQDKPSLVRSGQVTDAVVGMGWILTCKDSDGRDYICQPGKDFVSKSRIPAQEKKYLPPTGAPDRLKHEETGVGFFLSGARVSMEYPEECSVSADSGGSLTRTQVQVRCAGPKYQDGPKFSHYRVQYGIGRAGPAFSWDNNWGSGALTSATEVQQNYPNEAALRNVRAFAADGQKHGLSFTALKDSSFVSPKLTLRIVPVTADCADPDQAGILGCRNPLQGTVFENGFDGATAVPGSPSDLYFFKGNGYVRYNAQTDTVNGWGKDGKLLSLADQWPGLRGTGFENGIDAAVEVPNIPDAIYFFKGDSYLRYNVKEDKAETWGGDSPVLPLARLWPGLKGTGFENGFTAAAPVPGDADALYLFKGDSYLRYDLKEDKAESWGSDSPVLKIADHWPGLKGTGFEDGITAAAAVPGTTDAIYFFKGDSYLRYNLTTDKAETWGGDTPVLKIADHWPGLADAPWRARTS